jgi:histidinol phosphatase-like PHP family hydrolase
MKKVLCLLMLVLGVSTTTHAQLETPDMRDVQMVKGRILLVAIQEETTRALLDYRNKADTLKYYKDGIAAFNAKWKDAISKTFKFCKGIEYMSYLKVDKLVRENQAGKYAILTFDLKDGHPDTYQFGFLYGHGPYNNDIREKSKKLGYGVFRLSLATHEKTLREVYSVTMPVAYPSEADMIFALDIMQYTFTTVQKKRDYNVDEYKEEIRKNNKLLKKRNLLLDRDQIAAKTTREDLKEVYPYQFAIVDYDKIEEAVVNRDSSFAYVEIVPHQPRASDKNNSKVTQAYFAIVMDAGHPRVLAMAEAKRLNYNELFDDISDKEMKDFTKVR